MDEHTATPTPTLTDSEMELAEILSEIADVASDYRRQDGLLMGLDRVAKCLSDSPIAAYLSESYLQLLAGGHPDIPPALALVQDTILRYPERAHLRGAVFEIRWRTGKWKSQGAVVFGSCKPPPKADRECWTGTGPAPAFRLQLSLPYWLMATADERARLIHHELGHAAWKENGDPGPRPHDMEEFADTIARFGLREESATHAEVALALSGHPDTERRCRPYKSRQEELFKPVWQGFTALRDGKIRVEIDGQDITDALLNARPTPPATH